MDAIYLISTLVLISGLGGWWLHRCNKRAADLVYPDNESKYTQEEIRDQQADGHWLWMDASKGKPFTERNDGDYAEKCGWLKLK